MFGYAMRRLLGAIPTLFLIVTAAFFLMRVAPGGPFDQERTLEAKVMENLNRTFGLDKPVWEQYLYYLGTS
jgi:oligopeptide transport system permease protein